ncbi:MAG: hypothetical protein FJ257_08435 [Phycisphaerae bacterium]|nr:hypothetical protein [Phycisphaerae bacterium]
MQPLSPEPLMQHMRHLASTFLVAIATASPLAADVVVPVGDSTDVPNLQIGLIPLLGDACEAVQMGSEPLVVANGPVSSNTIQVEGTLQQVMLSATTCFWRGNFCNEGLYPGWQTGGCAIQPKAKDLAVLFYREVGEQVTVLLQIGGSEPWPKHNDQPFPWLASSDQAGVPGTCGPTSSTGSLLAGCAGGTPGDFDACTGPLPGGDSNFSSTTAGGGSLVIDSSVRIAIAWIPAANAGPGVPTSAGNCTQFPAAWPSGLGNVPSGTTIGNCWINPCDDKRGSAARFCSISLSLEGISGGCSLATAPTNGTTVPIVAAGGTSTVQVSTGATCVWSAQASDTWLTITSGSSGTGAGTINYTAAANSGATRSATIAVSQGGSVQSQITVQQAAGSVPCTLTTTPPDGATVQVAAAGGSSTVQISTGATCAWSAVIASTDPPGDPDDWIALRSQSGTGTAVLGTGTETIGIRIRRNTGAARSATITVSQGPEGGSVQSTITVQQAAGSVPCTLTTTPPDGTTVQVVAAGGTSTVQVSTGATCGWSAQASDAWLTITSGSSGTGAGTINYSAAANSGAARSATIAVSQGGSVQSTITVQQAAGSVPCTLTTTPPDGTTVQVAAGGESGSVGVSTGATCVWSAQASDTWLTITSGSSGTGAGTINYTAAANSGATRSATIAVSQGGSVQSTITVQQAAGSVACPLTTAPPNGTTVLVDAGGGCGSVGVSTDATCGWSAQASDAWLTISNGSSSGTGNGTINYSVATNSGATRSATIAVSQGGSVQSTITVHQAEGSVPCTPCVVSACPAPAGTYATIQIQNNFEHLTEYFGQNVCSDDIWLYLNAGAGGTVQYYPSSSGCGSPTTWSEGTYLKLCDVRGGQVFAQQNAANGAIYAVISGCQPPSAPKPHPASSAGTCYATDLAYAAFEWTFSANDPNCDLQNIDQFSYPCRITIANSGVITARSGFKEGVVAETILHSLATAYGTTASYPDPAIYGPPIGCSPGASSQNCSGVPADYVTNNCTYGHGSPKVLVSTGVPAIDGQHPYRFAGSNGTSLVTITSGEPNQMLQLYGQSFQSYLQTLYQSAQNTQGYYLDYSGNNGFSFTMHVYKSTYVGPTGVPNTGYGLKLTNFKLDTNSTVRCPFYATPSAGTLYQGTLTILPDGDPLLNDDLNCAGGPTQNLYGLFTSRVIVTGDPFNCIAAGGLPDYGIGPVSTLDAAGLGPGGIATYTGPGGSYQEILKSMIGSISTAMIYGMLTPTWSPQPGGEGSSFLFKNITASGTTVTCGTFPAYGVTPSNSFFQAGSSNWDTWTNTLWNSQDLGQIPGTSLYSTPLYVSTYGDRFGAMSPHCSVPSGCTVTWELGLPPSPPLPPDAAMKVCPGDLNFDGRVDGVDLTLLLGSWGACVECGADLNLDGLVDGADLSELLSAWGEDC